MLSYIQGKRRGKEARRVELESMRDPFLSEALEGYDMVKENHVERIEQLQQQILQRSKKKKRPTYLWYSVAASLLLLLAAGTYFLTRDTAKTDVVLAELSSMAPTAKFDDDTAATQHEQIAMNTAGEKKKSAPPVVAIEIDAEEAADKAMVSDEAAVAEEKNMESSEDGDIVIWEDDEAPAKSNTTAILAQKSEGKDCDTAGVFDTGASRILVAEKKSLPPEEAVVVGYGAKKRKELTGAASAITGKLAGVQVDENSTPTPLQPMVGMEEFNRYIRSNIAYPTDSCANVKGLVKLEFTVNRKTGKPENIKVQESLCRSSDAEAIRLLEHGPLWTKKKGKATVTVEF